MYFWIVNDFIIWTFFKLNYSYCIFYEIKKKMFRELKIRAVNPVLLCRYFFLRIKR